jgi:hypothetical protein
VKWGRRCLLDDNGDSTRAEPPRNVVFPDFPSVLFVLFLFVLLKAAQAQLGRKQGCAEIASKILARTAHWVIENQRYHQTYRGWLYHLAGFSFVFFS